ncbi:MAG: hypothetical protein RL095_2578 [Verrucomicrobiota bacterium]|jgi:pimeloyl-ACP methyl ester carboxylesterase
MIPIILCLAFATSTPPATPALPEPPAWQQPALRPVALSDFSWTDDRRGRELPLRLRLPQGKETAPVLLLSHGLGGSREGIAYLAEHLAARGWICLSLQHPGSDESIWQGQAPRDILAKFQKALKDPRQAIARAEDVRFVLDRLAVEAKNPASPLFGRVDLTRCALAGHSFGAWTATACAGRQTAGPRGDNGGGALGEPRLKAAIALSPQGQETAELERAASAGIFLPVLHITGGKDSSPVQKEMSPERRRLCFDTSPEAAGNRALLWFDVGDHMVFNGGGNEGLRGRRRDASHDAAIQARVMEASALFLAAEVLSDAAARRALREGRLQALMQGEGQAETRLLSPLAAEARLLLGRIETSKYRHGPQNFLWPEGGRAGQAEGDCSGFVDALLRRCHPQLADQLRRGKGGKRPLAADFAAVIRDKRGFLPVERIGEIRPGDLLAASYEEGAEVTGHVMIADGPALLRRDDTPPLLPGSRQWLIPVIDSSSAPHGPGDSRQEGRDGLGRGLLRLYADAEGRITAWSWSSLKASKLYLPAERPLVVGRVEEQ